MLLMFCVSSKKQKTKKKPLLAEAFITKQEAGGG